MLNNKGWLQRQVDRAAEKVAAMNHENALRKSGNVLKKVKKNKYPHGMHVDYANRRHEIDR